MTAPARNHRRFDDRRSKAELDQISDMLRARIADLVHIWQLKDGWREGHDWVCLNPLRADHTAKSFRISLSGPYQGMVKDFAGPFWQGKSTLSALNFHAALGTGGDIGRAVRWAKAWLGLDGANPEALQITHKRLRDFDDRPLQDEEAVKKKRKRAKAIYCYDVAPDILGTPVENYLLGRALDVRRLGFPVKALRWKELCPLGKDEKRPAMIAPITRPNPKGLDEFVGLHRTFLEQLDDGRWVKDRSLPDAKMSYGNYAGGAIRLWNGLVTDPETGEITYGQRFSQLKTPCWLDVTEGIEDGLSVVVACPEARVWVGVSGSNLKGLVLPPLVAGVRLWKQNEKPGSAAEKGWLQVADNIYRQGKAVELVDLPLDWKDPNEVLQAEFAHV